MTRQSCSDDNSGAANAPLNRRVSAACETLQSSCRPTRLSTLTLACPLVAPMRLQQQQPSGYHYSQHDVNPFHPIPSDPIPGISIPPSGYCVRLVVNLLGLDAKRLREVTLYCTCNVRINKHPVGCDRASAALKMPIHAQFALAGDFGP